VHLRHKVGGNLVGQAFRQEAGTADRVGVTSCGGCDLLCDFIVGQRRLRGGVDGRHADARPGIRPAASATRRRNTADLEQN